MLFGHDAHGVGAVGEERVEEVRNQDADLPCALLAQRSRQFISLIVKLLDHSEH
jgi:hypothetical protein